MGGLIQNNVCVGVLFVCLFIKDTYKVAVRLWFPISIFLEVRSMNTGFMGIISFTGRLCLKYFISLVGEVEGLSM